ncbi:MAG: hypothetical protein ACI9SK_002225 [Zhongshania sp.]|jgi:hypothetical protein
MAAQAPIYRFLAHAERQAFAGRYKNIFQKLMD